MPGIPYGRYELLQKLAAGGMAEIFLGRLAGESGFFRDVALKRLFQEFAESPSALRLFELEAKLMAHLSHPNIPQIIDFGEAEGTWFIAMEHVHGQTVADLWRAGVRAKRPMTLAVSIGVTMQVAEGLHHAHEAHDRAGRELRIIHRDVTPHNVMLTHDGVVKLMDFGVAQSAALPVEEVGVVRGTYSYMSPEQVQGHALDRRSDVFSLGVILYELTTGTRLFRGGEAQVMLRIVDEEIPLPSSIVAGYPGELEAIVMAALAKDPLARISSAADLALHLEDFAMRRGLLVGPRALARHVRAVLPVEPVLDPSLALVDPARDHRPIYTYRPPRTPLPEVELLDGEGMMEVSLDDAILFDDGGVAPAALEGFDEREVKQRPVILLDRRKDRIRGDGEYMSALRKRLETDEVDEQGEAQDGEGKAT